MNEPLCTFGYTEREAAFVRPVALMSGYFLRKQFNRFIGKECGAVGQRFVEKCVMLRHAEAIPALGGRAVYHLTGSELYRELGDAGNRNRRVHQQETIRRRLMMVDYFLLYPRGRWLLSEDEKVKHFGSLAVLREDLPAELFAGGRKSYFVDRQPIELLPAGNVRFAFIDEGLQTYSRWENFLKGHRKLLQQLPDAEVVFTGAEPKRFRIAEEIFRRTVAGETSAGGTDLERIERFFISRKLFDEKRYEQFDQARLNELRENRRVYAGAVYEQLFERWLVAGNSAFVLPSQSRSGFHAQVLPNRYEWLSPFRFIERRA
jgi:hypothetical protein